MNQRGSGDDVRYYLIFCRFSDWMAPVKTVWVCSILCLIETCNAVSTNANGKSISAANSNFKVQFILVIAAIRFFFILFCLPENTAIIWL